jgi:hypothetical protein
MKMTDMRVWIEVKYKSNIHAETQNLNLSKWKVFHRISPIPLTLPSHPRETAQYRMYSKQEELPKKTKKTDSQPKKTHT